jgi:hypothetical protein
MPSIDVTLETSLPPDAVRAALLDFSERRPDVWPSLARELYEVYTVGETSAEIKEGNNSPVGAFWARERYDWSDPDTVRWTVVESNFCAPGSYVSATARARASGGSRIDIHWERTPTAFKGRLGTRIILLTKGKPIIASVEKALRKLEASGPAPSAS